MWKKSRWPVIAVATVVLIGAGTTYAVASGGSTASYRTVAATTGDVEQTLSTSGTVDAAHRADLAFGTSGTVAKVEVALGDTVKTGQVIARLNATAPDAALTEAKASLAKAVAQLSSDETAQTSAVSAATSTGSGAGSHTGKGKGTGTGAGTGTGSGSSAASAATLKNLKELQQKVLDAQSDASQALADAAAALTAQTAACKDAFSASATATDAPSDTPTDGTGSADDAACTTALAAVQDAQNAVSKAQGILASALQDLSAALTKVLGSVGGTGATGSGSPTGHTSSARTAARTSAAAAGGTGSTGTGASGGSGGTGGTGGSNGGTVTAATLASDQAQIEQAKADLITAQQNRAQATLRSTRSGKVVALDIAKGDSASAGTTVATIVGGIAVTISGTVTQAQMSQVRLGQEVTVSVPGVSRTTSGTVSSIGLVPDSSTGTTSYPITVTVEDPTISLPTGSGALLQVVLATARGVVTVPTSAVTRTTGSTSGTVHTWNGSKLATVQVTLGAIGADRVAVASGLKSGTEVVLAQIDAPVKGASTTLTNNNRPNFANFQFRGAGGAGGGGAGATLTRRGN